MPFRHNPADSLADVIKNAGHIAGCLAGMDRAVSAGNGPVRDAVERCIERVCEAAHRLGAQATLLMPGQPRGEIRGVGQRLRHGYHRMRREVIWNAIHHDLPGPTVG